ncbi:MAG: thiamine pyrophosphate-dependent dehydrogenase E1 component subunit alpha [Anaerolineales bacterium]|nr:thiamine pyrophosphate-dependent dehydrogenase E1 component subunit alpha [Anaerolineales bacterium]
MTLTTEFLQTAYFWMRLTRAFDERVMVLHKLGKVAGGSFSQFGHEAISVGAALALAAEDVIAPMHRDLGAYLVRGLTPRRLMAQVLGRATGVSGGRDGNYHGCGDLNLNIIGFISHLPQSLPVAVGAAHAFQLRGERRVALTFFGDGSSSEGITHESMNWAALFRVPVVMICENNQYAYSTPLKQQMAVENVADRAPGYNLPAVIVDGNDVVAVYAATQQAVEAARQGDGPTLIECKTFRMRGHAVHDNQAYVPKELIAEWAKRDPILRFEQYLAERRLLSEQLRMETQARVDAAIDDAVAYAEASPLPDPATLTERVYAESN